MKDKFDNPSVKYCEAAKFIGRRTETEFSKLKALSAEVMDMIKANNGLKDHLKFPFIQYLNTDKMTEGRISVVVGYIVDDDAGTAAGFVSGVLPAGQYVVETVVGSYDQLQDANKHIQQWAEARGIEFKKRAVSGGSDWAARYELYLVGQESEKDPDKWQTEIRYLLT